MEMTINNAVLRYNLISVMKFIDGEYSLSRELKIKLIRLKLDLEKIRDEFVSFQQKAMEEIKTQEYEELLNKENKTPEEVKHLEEITAELNEELGKLIQEKSNEMVNVKSFDYLTEDEFNQILSVNVENNPTINGSKLDFDTYIELIYKNFLI